MLQFEFPFETKKLCRRIVLISLKMMKKSKNSNNDDDDPVRRPYAEANHLEVATFDEVIERYDGATDGVSGTDVEGIDEPQVTVEDCVIDVDEVGSLGEVRDRAWVNDVDRHRHLDARAIPKGDPE